MAAGSIKLTVQVGRFDSAQTNIPVVFNATLSSGTNAFSWVNFFAEMADADRKKVKIYLSDHTTELNAEIEPGYDFANDMVVYHVKANDADDGDIFYLDYDSTFADNTTYIGDTGDASAQAVWDAEFTGVYHMANDPDGDVADSIKDSTSNEYHGSPNGGMTSAMLIDADVGKAIDFNGGDWISLPAGVCVVGTGDFTTQAKAKTNTTSATRFLVSQRASGAANPSYAFVKLSTYKLQTQTYDGSVQQDVVSSASISTTAFSNLATVRSGGTNIKQYINGSLDTNETEGTAVSLTAVDLHIGRRTPGDAYWFGPISEVWFSNAESRSADWLKAIDYSLDDDMFAMEDFVSTKVDTPDISPTSGAVPSGQLITLTSANADSIYWTDTGVDPTTGDNLYTVPFAIISAVTIKAYGVAAGLDDSDVASESYTIAVVVIAVQPIITIQT